MTRNPTTKAWLQLLLLSGLSVVLAAGAAGLLDPSVTGVVVLALAWMKARVILSRYLGLWQAPVWQSGFNWVLALYCSLLLALYLIPAFNS